MTETLLKDEKTPVVAEDEVGQYMQDISRYPLLTPQQELDVAMACAAGDENAIRTMVNSNLRLVVSVARDYAGRGVPLLDLVQEGSIGLITAARKFDYTRNIRFSTYATKWIRQAIGRYLLEQAELIRVPAHTYEQMRRIRKESAFLQQKLGRNPTNKELAEVCGLPEKKLEKLTRLLPEICSLDAPVGDEEGNFLLLLQDMTAPQPQEELARRELKHTMQTLLSMLTSRQQQVLRLRFGMDDGEFRSLDEVGKMLDISKERARQVEQQAIKNLKKYGTDLGLEDFLE